MFKKLSYIVIGIMIGMLFSSTFAVANSPIKLIINNKEIQCDQPPQMVNNRVFVPLRVVAEALGTDVKWDGENNRVVITSKEQEKVIGDKTVSEPIIDNKISEPISNVINSEVNVVDENNTNNEQNNDLRIDSISKTTYKPADGKTGYKLAFVTVTMTNISTKHIHFKSPKPIYDIQDDRNISASCLWSNKYYLRELPEYILNDGFIPPNETVTLTFYATLLENTNIINWEFN